MFSLQFNSVLSIYMTTLIQNQVDFNHQTVEKKPAYLMQTEHYKYLHEKQRPTTLTIQPTLFATEI